MHADAGVKFSNTNPLTMIKELQTIYTLTLHDPNVDIIVQKFDHAHKYKAISLKEGYYKLIICPHRTTITSRQKKMMKFRDYTN